MSLYRFIHRPSTLLLMFGTLILATGCASRPRYGAAPRHKRGCDCPKWNAAPQAAGKDVHAQVTDPDFPRLTNAAHH